MKKITKNAMTLIELVIATILVGIVIMGSVSVEYAIRRTQKSASTASLVAIQVSTAMKQMTKDAMLAIGDEGNKGVKYDGVADKRNICFRQEDPNSGNYPSPDDYTDDKWTCFSQGDSSGTHITNGIYRCAGLNSELGIDQFCSSAPSETFILETTGDTTADQKGFFNVILGPSGKIETIEFNLESRADPSSDEHPITNPGYQLKSSVNPPGQSG